MRPLLAAVVLFAAFGASANRAPVTNSRMVPAAVQPMATDAAFRREAGAEWGFSPKWARYRQLMQGPLGVYSRPSSIRSRRWASRPAARKRRRYAELQVQAEARRVGKTLAYQRAYDAAWQRLFPASRA